MALRPHKALAGARQLLSRFGLSRIVVLVAIVGGVATGLASVFTRLMHDTDAERILSAPCHVADLHRSRIKQGPDAVAEIGELHLDGLVLEDGVVSGYGYDEDATLWIGWASDDRDAIRMVDTMLAGIAMARSPFEVVETRQSAERRLIVLDGLGKQHAVFADLDRVFWLAVEPAMFEQGLRDLLSFLATGRCPKAD